MEEKEQMPSASSTAATAVKPASFTTSLDPENFVGFLEKVFDFLVEENIHKEVAVVVRVVKKKISLFDSLLSLPFNSIKEIQEIAKMAGIGPLTQDWEPVVIRKKAPGAASKKDEKVVNVTRRAGAEIESVKKSNAGMNKAASSGTTLNTRKLDEETENFAHERVPTELKKAIMQARMDKKLTQAQLAQMINEKPQTIQEYESGKAIPNQQIIGKLERALGTKLRGKMLNRIQSLYWCH
ncbi:Endothelial differentiation-related factor 1-like protein [Hibiscus syriacus]|uniref:Endothelial differentiation-related factor 1-like protein n=2 Tax=Hibiscus syriacus TaxID=106335 RepID=A0A6A2YM82_HIBSY|nr:Endothelial differentiation-related factor 1-like protein [Hibiscus syriacus]